MNANNYINHDIKDIDAKTAKDNYYAYQDSLRQLQQVWFEKWCDKINKASLKGAKYFDLNQFFVGDDGDKILFIIDDDGCIQDCADIFFSLKSIKEYFEKRGFNVRKRMHIYPEEWYILRITWMD